MACMVHELHVPQATRLRHGTWSIASDAMRSEELTLLILAWCGAKTWVASEIQRNVDSRCFNVWVHGSDSGAGGESWPLSSMLRAMSHGTISLNSELSLGMNK
ncbi:hypothetical protein SCLCIDRAFT_1217012 [Scleroderma citrinum Foug A]|uniref:Uncharacterized protein n=1 Tax=Scleroderma citrinum Foug A TaxID=1036808 RepID=A0A0C3DHS0_9AGAM|nr:hypothetical protein SCLCIDRAFT_1217012 [Scleroderma citrinum Foug A]